MHTFSDTYGKDTVTIHYNGDCSGDAIVSVVNEYGTESEITVPAEALVDFSRNRSISTAISALEDLL